MKVFVIVDNNERFVDVKATRAEAEQLIKELYECLSEISVHEVTYKIKEKEI